MEIILLIISSAILLISIVVLSECIAALFPGYLHIEKVSWKNQSVAVLIPAHNEETEIDPTLKSILPQLKQKDRLVVIADNCSDRTAEIATAAGATVIERQELEHLGKGFALDYGLKFLATSAPDVVVLVDADCQVDPKVIQNLTEQAIATQRPVQAIYLMEQPAEATAKDAISGFAFKVKNLVRPQGLANLKQPCLLTGTGMAFPWSVIQKVDLASGNIVEDMKLGLDLALAGYPPTFCPQAKVTGRLPQKEQAAITQRTRWEHGHLQTLFTYVPRLLQGAIAQTRFDLLVMALDLCIPPLSLFVALWFGVTAISILAMIFGASGIPTLILTLAGLAISTAILTAWAKFGRNELPISTLIAIPFYTLWKIPLYFKFIFQRQNQWIRTERDS